MVPWEWHEAIHHDCQRPIPARREVRMSLRKKPTMTEEKISVNHANGRRSHGPTAKTEND